MTAECDGGLAVGGEVRSGGQEQEDEQRETREAAIQRYTFVKWILAYIPDCANHTLLLSSSVSIQLTRTRVWTRMRPLELHRIWYSPKNEEQPTRRILGEMIACTYPIKLSFPQVTVLTFAPAPYHHFLALSEQSWSLPETSLHLEI